MRKTVVILQDDLDRSDASESITFSLDGSEYEIDLNEAHANELREALTKYTAVARKTGGRGRPARRSSTGSNDTKAIRAWAIEKGIKINARGRIQAEVIEQYAAAH